MKVAVNVDAPFPRRARYRHRAAIVERQGGICPQCGRPLDLSIRPRYKFEAVTLDGYVKGASWADVTAVHTFCWTMRRLDEEIASWPQLGPAIREAFGDPEQAWDEYLNGTAGDEQREPAV